MLFPYILVVYLGDVVTDDTKESKIKLGDTGVQITQNISSQIVEVLDKENIPITLHGKKFLPDKKSLNFSEPEKQCSEGQTFRNGFCRKLPMKSLYFSSLIRLFQQF